MGWGKAVMCGGLGLLVGLESYLLSGVVYFRLGKRGFGLDYCEEDGERQEFSQMMQQCEYRSEEVCAYLSSLSNGGVALQALLVLSLCLSALSLLHSVMAPYCVRRLARTVLAGGQLSPWMAGGPRCLTLCQGLSLLNPVLAIAAIVVYPVTSGFPEVSQVFPLHADRGLIALAVEVGIRLLLYGWMIVEIVENRRKNSRLLEEEREESRVRAKNISDESFKAIHPAASADETRL